MLLLLLPLLVLGWTLLVMNLQLTCAYCLLLFCRNTNKANADKLYTFSCNIVLFINIIFCWALQLHKAARMPTDMLVCIAVSAARLYPHEEKHAGFKITYKENSGKSLLMEEKVLRDLGRAKHAGYNNIQVEPESPHVYCHMLTEGLFPNLTVRWVWEVTEGRYCVLWATELLIKCPWAKHWAPNEPLHL